MSEWEIKWSPMPKEQALDRIRRGRGGDVVEIPPLVSKPFFDPELVQKLEDKDEE